METQLVKKHIMKTFFEHFGLEQFQEKSQEIEATIYGKITIPDGLSRANKIEHHLQYEGGFKNGNRCRVRKTTAGDTVEHVLTMKRKAKGVSAVSNSTEYNAKVDSAFFDGFVATAAESKQNKTRYIFVCEDVRMTVNEQTVVFPKVVYEVDVFNTEEGPCEWCKIDIELQDLLPIVEKQFPGLTDVKFIFRVNHLPLGLVGCFLNATKTEEQAKLLDYLWDTKFKKKIGEAIDDRKTEPE